MIVVGTGKKRPMFDESWLACSVTFGGKAQHPRFWTTLLLATEAVCSGNKLN
jgi:hypothetical protein